MKQDKKISWIVGNDPFNQRSLNIVIDPKKSKLKFIGEANGINYFSGCIHREIVEFETEKRKVKKENVILQQRETIGDCIIILDIIAV